MQLPPLHTILRGGKRSGTKHVPVTLAARCTEIGTLELYCVAKEGNNRWRLEFNVRDIVKDSARARMPEAENRQSHRHRCVAGGSGPGSGPADPGRLRAKPAERADARRT